MSLKSTTIAEGDERKVQEMWRLLTQLLKLEKKHSLSYEQTNQPCQNLLTLSDSGRSQHRRVFSGDLLNVCHATNRLSQTLKQVL